MRVRLRRSERGMAVGVVEVGLADSVPPTSGVLNRRTTYLDAIHAIDPAMASAIRGVATSGGCSGEVASGGSVSTSDLDRCSRGRRDLGRCGTCKHSEPPRQSHEPREHRPGTGRAWIDATHGAKSGIVPRCLDGRGPGDGSHITVGAVNHPQLAAIADHLAYVVAAGAELNEG